MLNNVAPTVNAPVIMFEPSVENKSAVARATFSDPAGLLDKPYKCTVNYGELAAEFAGCGDRLYLHRAGAYVHQVWTVHGDGQGYRQRRRYGFEHECTPGEFQLGRLLLAGKDLPKFNSVKAGSVVPVKLAWANTRG